MNDVMNLWTMITLSNYTLLHSKGNNRRLALLNMDGFRYGGPAGRGHRIITPGAPDNLGGPFAAYFESWFGRGNLLTAIQYGKKKICFREIYFPITPGDLNYIH